MKYKPCCDLRCLLSKCETRDCGGCYCVCRLKDFEKSCLSLLEGRSYRSSGCIIYEPGRTPIPLEGEEKEKVLADLEHIRNKLKTYETNDS